MRRLDTYRVLRVGSVRCAVSLCGRTMPAVGGFRDSRAECGLRFPTSAAAGAALRGAITVRAAGASLRSTFRFVVR